MGCPEPEALAQLGEAGGDPELRAAIADHAASCESCHAALVAVLDAPQTLRGAGVGAVAETLPAGADDAGGELQRVDRYVIKHRIGAGAMGVVYAATDSELGRDVAIKMLRRGASAARLRREAQALARLDHRNVVAVHDVGEHDGQVFVAMALVDGDNLRSWLAGDRSATEILRVIVEAGQGLVAAHAAGLVHRDLKPDNIFVARDGDVLVGDFGLARATDDGDDGPAPIMTPNTSLTMTGMVIGTPAYMAPEQADGTATERSDQFSFCVTAYEALCGVRPFAGDSLEALLASVRAGRFVEGDRPVPARIARALRRGLAADPDARYPTMAALLADLAPRSRRRWWWLAPIAAAIAATGIWLAVRGSAEAPDCAATRAELAGTWNPERATALRRVLAARLTPAAAAELVTRLDDHAARWQTVREEICTAMPRLSTEQLAARLACLGERSDELAEAIRRLDTDREADAVGLWQRLTALWPAEACRDDAAARLAVGNPAHRALMREIAAIDVLTGDTTPLVAMRARADAAGDTAALLEIDLVVGEMLLSSNALGAADITLRSALAEAEHLGIASKRLVALALLATSACKQHRFDESAPLLMMADADVRRDATGAIDGDDVLAARAECLVQKRSADAIPMLRDLVAHAIARYGPDSPGELHYHARLVDLFYGLNRIDEGQREVAAFERIAGRFFRAGSAAARREDDAGEAAFRRADLDAAIEHHRRAVELWDRDHETERTDSLSSLAIDYEVSAQWRLAAATYDEIVTRLPADAPSLRTLRVEALLQGATSHLVVGELDAAATRYDEAAVEARVVQYNAYVFEAELGRGRVAVERGDFVRGVRLLKDTLAGYMARTDAVPYRIGTAQFALARALWETGDRPGAVAIAAQAEANLGKSIDEARANPLGVRMAIFRSGLVADVAAWRDKHR